MMNKLTIALLLIPFSIYSQTRQAPATGDGAGNDWKTLDLPQYSIQYPASWKPDLSKEMGSSFILFSPLASPKDNFSENVNLLIQDLKGQNINLAKYTEISEKQIRTLGTNSSIVESKKIKKGNDEYQRIIYNNDQGGFHLKFIQYYFLRAEKTYVLTFTAEQTTFDVFREVGEKILTTFKFKK